MGTKGIDQRPYDREKFNNNFDAIFGKKKDKKEEEKDERRKPSINGNSKAT